MKAYFRIPPPSNEEQANNEALSIDGIVCSHELHPHQPHAGSLMKTIQFIKIFKKKNIIQAILSELQSVNFLVHSSQT